MSLLSVTEPRQPAIRRRCLSIERVWRYYLRIVAAYRDPDRTAAKTALAESSASCARASRSR